MRLRIGVLALAAALAAPPALSAQPAMVDTVRARRWAALHVAVIAELRRDGRDLRDAIRGDFSTLEIAVRRTNDTTFTSRILTIDEIDKADLPALAKRIVAESSLRKPARPDSHSAPAARRSRSTST